MSEERKSHESPLILTFSHPGRRDLKDSLSLDGRGLG